MLTTTNVYLDQPIAMATKPLTDSTLALRISQNNASLPAVCLFIERQHIGAFLDALDQVRAQIDAMPVEGPWQPVLPASVPATPIEHSDDDIPF